MSHQSPPTSRTGPQHIAIIMDGNGRWAQQRGLARNEGHRQGVQNVQEVVRMARDNEVPFLTLFAFSSENWNRPRHEVEALMFLLERFLNEQGQELMKHGIRLRILGRIHELPHRVSKLLEKWIGETRHFTRWNLTLALNYGSRTEMVDAMKAYAKAVQDGLESPETLDWQGARRFLYSADMPDPDLVIRTSGEHRVSNFLLLQSAYAEYYFIDKYWPEFGDDDFKKAIAGYCQRERRYGKTTEQLQTTTELRS